MRQTGELAGHLGGPKRTWRRDRPSNVDAWIATRPPHSPKLYRAQSLRSGE